MQALLMVGAGGAIGAMSRYGSGQLIARLFPGTLGGFPVATLSVNIIGSLLMGILVGYLARYVPGWQAEARLFIAVGILGGFTTFSAFSLDAIILVERGAWGAAALYVVVSVVFSIFALFLGLLAVRSFGF